MNIVNTAQAEHWNTGDAVDHWVVNQDRYDRMNAPFAAMILDAARLGPGTDVLDVGCGCGGTTLAAARLVTPGQAVGLDLSGPMLARARARAEAAGLGNAEFRPGDAQVQPLEPAGSAPSCPVSASCSSPTRSPPSRTSGRRPGLPGA